MRWATALWLVTLTSCGRVGYDLLVRDGDGGVADGDGGVVDGSIGLGDCPVPTLFENEFGGAPTASGVASVDSDLLMTWITAGELRAQRATATGSVVGAVNVVVDIDSSITGNSAAVAPGLAGYAIPHVVPAGGNATDVHLALVTSAGFPGMTNIDMTAGAAAQTTSSPELAGDEQRFGVIWVGNAGGLSSVLLRVRDLDGVVGSVEVMRDPASSLISRPQIAWNGSRFGVVWSDGAVQYAAATADGTRVAPPVVVMAGQGVAEPRIAPFGSGFAVVWRTGLAILDQDGAVAQSTVISADDTSVASRGEVLMVGMRIGSELSLQRFDANLTPLGQPIPLGTENTLTAAPYVEETTEGWLAVWRRAGGVSAFRIATVCE